MKNQYSDLIEVIIPTHNRTDLLKRVLDYYSQIGADLKFIVADSSSSRNKHSNKKLIGSYPNLRIVYIEDFPENLQQHLKFAEMVKFVKTKYVCFCPDDDFITPQGIMESVDFLEKNPDYSAAHGAYIGFHLFKGPLHFRNFWWNFRYKNQSLLEGAAAKRLSAYLKNLNLVMWSVRRSNMLKAAYEQLVKANFDPLLLLMYGELLPDCLTVIEGKVKRLTTFYAARQYFSSIATNYSTLNDVLNKQIYKTEYAKFKNILVQYLVKKDGLSLETASSVVDLAMEQYLKYSYQEYFINRINRFLRDLPILKKIFRLVHATYLLSKDKESKIGPINSGSSKYYQDFEMIRQLVLKN